MQWSVPEISDENAGTDSPTVVVYPHFASSGMHSDYVDWYHKLTVSQHSTLTSIQRQILGRSGHVQGIYGEQHQSEERRDNPVED